MKKTMRVWIFTAVLVVLSIVNFSITTTAASTNVGLTKTRTTLTIKTTGSKRIYGTTVIKVKSRKSVKIKKITYKNINKKIQE